MRLLLDFCQQSALQLRAHETANVLSAACVSSTRMGNDSYASINGGRFCDAHID
jgi:glycosylphosphatidylinositol transamidase (GPIT) subunit GPI8